jgi:hypothetical protein
MPATKVNLSQMVDLAVGTSEVGAVNCNVLHTLLHAMLHKIPRILGIHSEHIFDSTQRLCSIVSF